MHGWGDGYAGWMGSWMLLWWAVGLVFLVLILWAALRAGGPSGARETPEQILKRRYASGELDRETYQRMRADLREQDRGLHA